MCKYVPGNLNTITGMICSPNGGQFVQRCSAGESSSAASPILDTSNCVDCKYHPGSATRKCELSNHYIVQYCREGGVEVSDVSACEPCKIKEDDCPRNKRHKSCNGDTDWDTSDCINCDPKRCNVGQYFSGRCTCSNCTLQPMDCRNMGSATIMNYYGCQGGGIVDDGDCKSSKFDCGPECIDGISYESTSCAPGNDMPRICKNCSSSLEASTLGVTQYVQFPCSALQDSVLKPCTKIKACPVGYTWSNCTKDRDGMCLPCTNKICGSGQFLSQCLPDKDSACVACNSSLKCSSSSSVETYRAPCSQSQDHVCKSCTKCQLGATFEYLPCTNVSDRVCMPCTSLGACPPGQYKRSSCTLTRDTDCQPCSTDRFPCPYGTFESAPCTAVSDRVCSPCKTECPAGSYMVSGCTAKKDAECKSCSSPVCTVGFYKTECKGSSDSVCAPCSYPSGCPADHFENQTCTMLQDRKCKKCGACLGNTYQVSPCTGTSDTVCNWCTNMVCSEFQYQTQMCSKESPGSSVCTQCAPRCEYYRILKPQYTIKNCSGLGNVAPSNRVCADCRTSCTEPGDIMLQGCTEFRDIVCKSEVPCDCPAGQYISKPCQGVEPAVCTPVSHPDGICPRGYYREAAATPTSDIVCKLCPTSCPYGFFQKSPPPPSSKLANGCSFECTPCGKCPFGQERVGECNATSDVQCDACSDICGADDPDRNKGLVFENVPCWDTTPATCMECTRPVAGEYLPPQNGCNRRNNSRPLPCKYVFYVWFYVLCFACLLTFFVN